MKKFVFLALVLVVLSACIGTQLPTASSTPKPAPTERGFPLTATVEALKAREAGGIRFMTYNLFVGGMGRGDETNIDRILSIINTYNPDVLGIQEANGWDFDNFAIAQYVADGLDMSFVYCKAENSPDPQGNSWDTIIMTKFEILESESFPDILHCAGRAEILLPDDQPIQVFNVHVPVEKCKRLFPQIVEMTRPYMDGLAVMMGDFNVIDPEAAGPDLSGGASFMQGCPELLVNSGWVYLPGSRFNITIDQIWVSPIMGDYEYFKMIGLELLLVPHKETSLAADRRPVAVDIYFP